MADREGRSDRPRVLPRGVRFRTTVVATVVVGSVLVGVSVGVIWFVDRTLTEQVHEVLVTRARELAGSSIDEAVASVDPEEEFVQVLDGTDVIAASSNVTGLPAITRLSVGDESAVTMRIEPGEDETDRVLVLAVPFDDHLALVGRSLGDVGEATQAVAAALLVGVPVVVIVVGLLTWMLVGLALAPVEAMRAEAERISAAELDRRLPDAGARDEVGRLAGTLNGMLARLEGSQRRQRRFVSDASHELRSPIASIRQHAEIARRSASPPMAELAETVLADVSRLQGLVDDLLLLANLDEGARPSLEEVDVDDLLLTEAERLKERSALRIDTTGVAPGRVVGNAVQLGRLFRNLADNAARHAEEVVALGVVLADAGSTVVATVDDDGPGIPEGDRERVFERFVRLDEGRGRREGGTGLGLAIVRDVARTHGGRVELGSSPLGGLRATVILPASR